MNEKEKGCPLRKGEKACPEIESLQLYREKIRLLQMLLSQATYCLVQAQGIINEVSHYPYGSESDGKISSKEAPSREEDDDFPPSRPPFFPG